MATLLLSAVGTLVGGPIGGALGALAGQQLDQAVIGSKTRKGPRVKDLAVQSSSYGAPIPRHYGRMRAAGSVIWATELVEHSDKQGGGKGRPKTVTYSYSSSFAVALASRPILGIGRIWADGNLLRGAAGDLKTAGELRLHHGFGDQPRDPLIAASEGAATCPAFRNTAYAVFEDLALADFGNRIPSLTFEVIADGGEVTFASMIADVVPGAVASDVEGQVTGYTVESGSGADLLETLGQVTPLSCVVEEDRLRVRGSEQTGTAATALPEPLTPRTEGAPAEGLVRHRERLHARPPAWLRYYDVARDFQPGTQRAPGRSLPGQPETIEFPAAISADVAQKFADALARRARADRETATYRISQLDSAFSPGQVASIAGDPARWLVEDWDWTSDGVELNLRALPHLAQQAAVAADAGRANVAHDRLAAPTLLAAFELPWDGIGTGDAPAIFAAASSASSGWTGAALFARQPDDSLVALGPSGRRRAIIGTAVDQVGPASPHALDRLNAITVDLASADMTLAEATMMQLATGANRALVGNELIQFGRAAPLGGGRWILRDLLRGRGGTEGAVASHGAAEPFVLLDARLTALDPAIVGDAALARVAALGLGDGAPVIAPILLAGSTQRPLSPVHGRIVATAAGAVELTWTRRARGAWQWRDNVEVPVGESAEAYTVTLGEITAPVAIWNVAEPRLAIDVATTAQLRTAAPGAMLAVRQRGDRGLSEPLPLGPLP